MKYSRQFLDEMQDLFTELCGYCKASNVMTAKPVKCGERFKKELDSVKKLEEDLNTYRSDFDASYKPLEHLQEELETLERRLDERNTSKERKKRQKQELELEYAILSKDKTSENSTKENKLEETMLRYKAIRNILQVKFVYDDIENNVLKGYTFNKSNNKIKPFEINLSKMNEDEVVKHIFHYMELTSDNNYTDIPLDNP